MYLFCVSVSHHQSLWMSDSCTESPSTPPNFASLPFLYLFYPLSWQWPPFPCLHLLPYKIGKVLILAESNHQPFLDRAAERSWGESYDHNCKLVFSIFKATQQPFYFLTLFPISDPDQWSFQTLPLSPGPSLLPTTHPSPLHLPLLLLSINDLFHFRKKQEWD